VIPTVIPEMHTDPLLEAVDDPHPMYIVPDFFNSDEAVLKTIDPETPYELLFIVDMAI
jgi:hypothetical protein